MGRHNVLLFEILCRDILVALVVISNGPLFVDIRRIVSVMDGRHELQTASDGMHLQFYIPAVTAS